MAKKEQAATNKASPKKASVKKAQPKKAATKKAQPKKTAAKKAPPDKEIQVRPSPEAVRRVSQNAILICIELLDVRSQFFPEVLAASESTVTQNATVTMDLVIDEPREQSNGFEVRCSFGLREIPDDQEAKDDPELILKVMATFRLGYRLVENAKLSDEDLLAFSIISAVRQAWPYWRELVQSMTSRMGQTPILVPLMPPPNGERVKAILSKRIPV